MRLALACLTSPKGDIDGNLGRHLAAMRDPAAARCDLVVFPEMSLTGYLTPAAGWDRAITLDHEAVATLVDETRGEDTPGAVFGVVEQALEGRFVTQVVAVDGEVVLVQRKRHLGEDEHALFTAAPIDDAATAVVGGRRVAIAICAELAHEQPFTGAAEAGAEVVLCCAAPGLAGRRTDEAGWQAGYDWWRGEAHADLARYGSRCGLWSAVATATGATADEDFPGWAALVSPTGQIVAETTDWREQTLVVDVPATWRF